MERKENRRGVARMLLGLSQLLAIASVHRMGASTAGHASHAITGRLGDRSRWGFDVRRVHLRRVRQSRGVAR